MTQAGRYLSALEEDAGAFDAALEGGAGNTDDAAVILDAYLVQARHRTPRVTTSLPRPPPPFPPPSRAVALPSTLPASRPYLAPYLAPCLAPLPPLPPPFLTRAGTHADAASRRLAPHRSLFPAPPPSPRFVPLKVSA